MSLEARLGRVIAREPLSGGRSGATVERVLLADGRSLVVKRSSLAADLFRRITEDRAGREFRLWKGGFLDRLTGKATHAVVDGWEEADANVLVMRDLRDGVLQPGDPLTREQARSLLAAAASIHEEFAGDGSPPPDLCRLEIRITIFAPWRYAQDSKPDSLGTWVRRGWERFADLAPAGISDPVLRTLESPALFAGPLAARPCTLVHGDFWPANLAQDAGRIVFFDWAVATWAPPALELPAFLLRAAIGAHTSPDQLIDDFREFSGQRHDAVALRLAMLAGLVEHGWSMALDATGPDAGVRRDAEDRLAWWGHKARQALELGLIA